MKMQMPGGHLLVPGLTVTTPLFSSKKKMQIESHCPHHEQNGNPFQWIAVFLVCIYLFLGYSQI